MDGIVIDLVIVGLVLIFAIIGFYKGFLRELISLVGFFGSLVISYFAAGYFTNFLNSVFGWGVSISNFVVNQISGISSTFATETGSTVEELQTIINSSGTNIAYKEILKQLVTKASFTEGAVTVAGVVGIIVSGFLMLIISFVVLFLLLRLVVFILDKLLSRIPRKSAIGTVNKWLGLLIGFVKGCANILIVLGVVYLLCFVPSINDFVMPYIETSYVTKFLYNLLGQIILGVGLF